MPGTTREGPTRQLPWRDPPDDQGVEGVTRGGEERAVRVERHVLSADTDGRTDGRTKTWTLSIGGNFASTADLSRWGPPHGCGAPDRGIGDKRGMREGGWARLATGRRVLCSWGLEFIIRIQEQRQLERTDGRTEERAGGTDRAGCEVAG